jgi:short-subunit dehydrogenase
MSTSLSRGNAAYNASKAAVKSLTEGLSHELRGRSYSNVTAHLFMYVRFTYVNQLTKA